MTTRNLSIPFALLLSLTGVATGQQYKQTNLVANISGVAPNTDRDLSNAWGISRTSGGEWWVADTATGLSTLYNGTGVKSSLVVKIPKADPTSKTFPAGTPTGTIANASPTDFLLAPGKSAVFLFCTLDGTISAWNPGVGINPGGTAPSTNAVIVVNKKDGSSYTGLTSAFVNGGRFLYSANFSKGRVDIFDNAFHSVSARQFATSEERDSEIFLRQSKPFTDDFLPAHFAPYNVQAIGNDIVVTYAEQPPSGEGPEVDGPGLGYIDIFTSSGRLVRRLEHGDWLNAPWGVALAPLDFGRYSHDLLVGQFGGGRNSESAGLIAAYDLASGKFDGLVEDTSGNPLVIAGLWGLSVGNVAPNSSDPAGAPAGEVYFAAGPNGTGGLFGYISPVPSTLVKGNDQ